MTWLRTYTGKRFDVFAPDPLAVDIIDIAWALSNECRFAGHTSAFYSVAQHSVHVRQIVEELGGGLWLQLKALLHDATEAYLCDIPSPLKRHPSFMFYRELEENLDHVIMIAFGLAFISDTDGLIKKADNIVLAAEARDLMGDPKDWDSLPEKPWKTYIKPLRSERAGELFLKDYQWLQKELMR